MKENKIARAKEQSKRKIFKFFSSKNNITYFMSPFMSVISFVRLMTTKYNVAKIMMKIIGGLQRKSKSKHEIYIKS